MGRVMRAPAVLIALVAFAAVAAPAASASPALPLDHAGRWITDAQGRVVVLHGLNMVNKRPPYAPDAVGFGDDDAAFLASEGYDTVRLGIIYAALEPQPGVYDDAYLDRIAQTVETLGRHGIVSLLDFHQDLYNERFQGEGWPAWAVQDDGLPAQPQSGFPGNYLAMPALQRAFDHFWADDPGPGGVGLQDRYAAAWRHVAERFRDRPAVLGYDLLNEPWPGSTWQQCANPAGCPEFDARLSAFTSRTLHAIRAADPSTLVFYEPNVLFNNGSDTNLAAFGDPHAAFSFHDYCLPAGSSNSNQGCDQSDDLVFANAEKRSAATGDSLLLTEFGATDAADVLGTMVARADRTMVGWQEWHYCGCDDPTTSGPGSTQALVLDPAKAPEGANLKTAKLQLLSRPYPQAVAGTPRGWSFDPGSRRFHLVYGTARAGGGSLGPGATTEIVLPRRQYPSGYGAEVRGGAVRSAPGANPLVVQACRGADDVDVVVTPGAVSHASCAAPGASGGLKASAGPRLRLRVSPRHLRARRSVRLRFTVTSRVNGGARPVRGATVRFAGHKRTSSRTGRVVMRVRQRRPGLRRATARAAGFRPARVTLRVRRR